MSWKSAVALFCGPNVSALIPPSHTALSWTLVFHSWCSPNFFTQMKSNIALKTSKMFWWHGSWLPFYRMSLALLTVHSTTDHLVTWFDSSYFDLNVSNTKALCLGGKIEAASIGPVLKPFIMKGHEVEQVTHTVKVFLARKKRGDKKNHLCPLAVTILNRNIKDQPYDLSALLLKNVWILYISYMSFFCVASL